MSKIFHSSRWLSVSNRENITGFLTNASPWSQESQLAQRQQERQKHAEEQAGKEAREVERLLAEATQHFKKMTQEHGQNKCKDTKP